jgi:hypothetical protein
VVVSAFNAVDTGLGGHFWAYAQFVHGLRSIGFRVHWLERTSGTGDSERDSRRAARFQRLGAEHGLDGVILYRSSRASDGRELRDYLGWIPGQVEEIFGEADLLLNFHYAVDPSLLSRFRRTALVDIDPGLLQVWISTGQLTVAPHDVYFTTGETVGTPAARFADCGLPWVHINPPVSLEQWPYAHDPNAEAFTTVSNWWGGATHGEWFTDGNGFYENNKRVSFLEVARLPRLVSQRLELALCLGGESDQQDRRHLEACGWRVRDAAEVAGDPHSYRSYVQRSRGHFSCAKPSYVRLRTAWVGDRTPCYLASGKPVVVQDTGPSSCLPDGDGVFRFSNLAGAARALAAVDADYAGHCQAARALAEAHFDAGAVAARILDVALARRPRARAANPAACSPIAEQDLPEELRRALSGLLRTELSGRLRSWQQLKPRVYRLLLDVPAGARGVILKRLDPVRAERNRLVVERWLPAFGYQGTAPRLLEATADAASHDVWHLYEDLGDVTMDSASQDGELLRSAVALFAGLHTRSKGQALLAECRLFGGDLGVHFYESSAVDAVRGLAALSEVLPSGAAQEVGEVVDRLRGEAQRLLDERRWRTELIADLGGPESMLHGDLWPANVLFTEGRDRAAARLIDWDHAGVGPPSYDVSTFVSRFPPAQRRRLRPRS